MNLSRKPWENPSENYRSSMNIPDMNKERSSLRQEEPKDRPPPVPARLNALNSSIQPPFLGGYGGMFGNPYSNYLYGSPGYGLSPGGGMFTSTPYNNSFSNGIDYYTQPTFQSAQSVIQAFSSVSMMLESTLFAIQNSVRAVVSVADQFSKLREQLVQSWMSSLQIIKYYFRKLLVMFRVKKAKPSEEIWNELATGLNKNVTPESRHWVIVLFFAVVLGTPWIMWKLLRLSKSPRKSNDEWDKGVGEHFLAECKYSYDAANTDELSISTNEIIRIAPKHKQPYIRGWLLASNGNSTGIVPANYIKILGKNREVSVIGIPSANKPSAVNEMPSANEAQSITEIPSSRTINETISINDEKLTNKLSTKSFVNKNESNIWPIQSLSKIEEVVEHS